MDIIWIILGALLIGVGLLGSILPVMPGPPIGYAGLLLLQLTSHPPFGIQFLLIWAFIVGLVMILDNFIPAYGTKRYGGSVYGIAGSMLGLVAGIFFAPIGIVVGPLTGAFLGEMAAGKDLSRALRSAWGSFAGFLGATLLKVITTCIIGYYFVTSI